MKIKYDPSKKSHRAAAIYGALMLLLITVCALTKTWDFLEAVSGLLFTCTVLFIAAKISERADLRIRRGLWLAPALFFLSGGFSWNKPYISFSEQFFTEFYIWAVLFGWLAMALVALPVFLVFSKRMKIGFLHCILSGAVLGGLLSLLLLFAGPFDPHNLMGSLFSGAIIGVIFWAISIMKLPLKP